MAAAFHVPVITRPYGCWTAFTPLFTMLKDLVYGVREMRCRGVDRPRRPPVRLLERVRVQACLIPGCFPKCLGLQSVPLLFGPVPAGVAQLLNGVHVASGGLANPVPLGQVSTLSSQSFSETVEKHQSYLGSPECPTKLPGDHDFRVVQIWWACFEDRYGGVRLASILRSFMGDKRYGYVEEYDDQSLREIANDHKHLTFPTFSS